MSDYKYFTCNKIADWAKGLAINLQVAPQGLSIAQRDKANVERIIPGETFERFSEIVDFAIGTYNTLYILDEKLNLWLFDYQNETLEPWEKNRPDFFSRNSKIRVWRDILYIADPGQENRISAVSLSNGQVIWTLREVGGYPLVPVDIAPDRLGKLYAIAEIAEHNLTLLEINDAGRIVNSIQNEYLTIADNIDHGLLRHKIFLETCPDGTCCIMNAFAKTAFKLSPQGQLTYHLELSGIARPYGLGSDDKGHLYIGDLQAGAQGHTYQTIKVFDGSGNELGIMAGYRGKLHKFVLDGKNRIYLYNLDENSITILKRDLVVDDTGDKGLPWGIFISPAFDSTVAETIWHKFLFDAILPDDTQMNVYYFTSEQKEILLDGAYVCVDSLLKDSAYGVENKYRMLEPFWKGPIVNPTDALINGGKGRYLWVKIELVGSNNKTPLIKSMRIEYPRTSYLRYLPAVYQEDEQSREFLERFLSLFATYFNEMEEKIEQVTGYLDAGAVSGDFLRWLASWLGISVDDNWDDEKLRALISKAPEIHQQRGTRQGLEMVLETFTGEKPLIIEQFQLKHTENHADIKRLMESLYGTEPYEFYVLIKPYLVNNENMRAAVTKILEDLKPAYTEGILVLLQPWIYLDRYTYLGVNTYLSEPSVLKLDQESRMPENTVLIDTDEKSRLEGHSRLGLGIELR